MLKCERIRESRSRITRLSLICFRKLYFSVNLEIAEFVMGNDYLSLRDFPSFVLV